MHELQIQYAIVNTNNNLVNNIIAVKFQMLNILSTGIIQMLKV